MLHQETPCAKVTALPDWLPSICADWWDAWKKHNVGVTADEARRAEACTWEAAGCADFYPEYSKRELPDTPNNECHAEICLRISPFIAAGCPDASRRVRLDERAGISVSASDMERLRFCIHLPGNPAYKNYKKPPPGRRSTGKAYTLHMCVSDAYPLGGPCPSASPTP
jgi:hypothetical protein